MSNLDLALRFVRSFCSGDVPGIEGVLGDDFTLSGPLFKFDSKSAYIRSLEEESLEPARMELIEMFEGENCVALFYRYIKPSGSNVIAQVFWFRNERISRTLLVFDSAGIADPAV